MAPSELGAYLQRHREEQGLSLDECEERTRIRRKYLEAIEQGEWGELPPGVYTRGLIRNYAKAIGVSTATAQRMYVKERPSEARVPEPQLLSQPLVQQPRLSFELVAALGLLAVAVALFAWMVSSLLLPTVQRAGIDLAENPLATTPVATKAARPTSTAPTPTPVRVSRAIPLTDAERTDVAAPRPTVTPTRAPTQGTSGKLELVVLANSDAWLMVRADGQQVFLDLLRKGESKRWTANERFRLRTGNAGGTEITINGQTIAPLGGPGEVEEREWRLLPDGNIEQSN
jgi:cytoskeletal protein RodZ